ncbi:SGNH/GDSL hydrolase family protein [Alkalihalophilus marmarensis]|uniref:SGNH/GDSL hydrolase family protein n=1 Tax=Alkalihalophilus marmarensis TaxID=521377 RepID=UPI002E1F00E6|nr:SGNH/GDSL hydrolase family protein [Alkalihalophilus marmarensis]
MLNFLKSIVPLAAVGVLLVALYVFKHDDMLTEVEAGAIDYFYTELEQQEMLAESLGEALDHPRYAEKKDQIIGKYQNNQTISIAVIGSDAHAQGEMFENGQSIEIPSWPDLAEEDLNELYGEEAFDIQYLSGYKDLTTSEFYAGEALQQIEAMNPDIIVFEPFLLNDHSILPLDKTIMNLSSIVSAIDALERFAQEEDLPYLDHWDAWPLTNDQEIGQYLVELPDGKFRPNKQGHTVWSEKIVDYFAGNE